MKQYSKYTDSELVKAICSEKAEAEPAFAELYSRYSQRVYAYILRVVGSADDARDLYQETFLKFYSSVQEKGDLENVIGFILTIARNLCLNFKRDKKLNFDIDDYNFFTNDKSYEQKELLDLIAASLEVLDFEYREAFILRQYHGLSYKEIAAITGGSVSLVKNRVWRAKEKIKNILTPYLQDMSN